MSNRISQRRALLIGINYLNSVNNRLFGCINDVINIRTMLMKQFGYTSYDIITLRDDVKTRMPTKINILNGLNRIAAISTPTSETVIHYSGHGGFLRDLNGDESDGMDEAIVPFDVSSSGVITDDEIFSIISRVRGRVLLFFDSCYSGSVCDLQYSCEYIDGVLVKKVNNNKYISNPNIIMMSGSRDDQTSSDSYNFDTRQSIGAFTDNLIRVISTKIEPIDMLEVYKSTCDKLSLAGYTQLPVFSSSLEQPRYLYGRTVGIGKTSFGTVLQRPKSETSILMTSNKNIIRSIFKSIINR